jgi:ABC-type Co2+ transport system permease subunit
MLFIAKPLPCITTCILILIITFVIPVVIPCGNYLVVMRWDFGKYIAGKASALALCISYIIMLHSCCFHPENNTTVMVFYYGEKKPNTILYDLAYTN